MIWEQFLHLLRHLSDHTVLARQRHCRRINILRQLFAVILVEAPLSALGTSVRVQQHVQSLALKLIERGHLHLGATVEKIRECFPVAQKHRR